MKDKQDVMKWLETLPDYVEFNDDILWMLRGLIVTYIPTKRGPVTITFNRDHLEFLTTRVTGEQIMEAAGREGYLRPYEKILLEELPNGTSRVIKSQDIIQLREYMKFSAMGRE